MTSPRSSPVPVGSAGTLSDSRLFRQAAYIDGRWIAPRNGSANATPVDNPATGDTLGVVPNLNASDARAAIDAADRAFVGWRATTAKTRAAALRCWFELMLVNQEDLVRLVTLEQSKPLAEAKSEVAYAASFLE